MRGSGSSESDATRTPPSPLPVPRFVGAIDQGTTSSRFLIFDQHGAVVARSQLEFQQYYPEPGWHEHDPLELVASVEHCINAAVVDFEAQGHAAADIGAVGITNQRETTVVWDWTTGEPLHRALVWTDTRCAELVRKLKWRLGSADVTRLCGLPLSTYPSAAKLLWLLAHVPRVRDAYDAGRLAFGTVDAWLVYKLNGGLARNVLVTDPTNASRTMFMGLDALDYDDRLLDFFRLDRAKLHLPTIVRSSHPHAYGALASTVLKGAPITACLGDQSAALLGQKGFAPGTAKNTYGTGCFLLYNCGPRPVTSTHGLATTVAYDLGPAARMYALEGSIAVAGSSVKFISDNFGFVESPDRIGALAETVDDNGGVVFVTAFSGLFAPYWVDDARGTLFGLTAHTQKGHVARATLEATCFQTKAILDAMEKDSGHALTELAVDGGMCTSDLTMQASSMSPEMAPYDAAARVGAGAGAGANTLGPRRPKPTSSASPSAARPWPKRRRWAPPWPRAWPSACGRA